MVMLLLSELFDGLVLEKCVFVFSIRCFVFFFACSAVFYYNFISLFLSKIQLFMHCEIETSEKF